MAQRRIKKIFNLDLPQHKRANITDEAKDELQVIGAGLPRSGTTSLKAALEILGFDPCHHMSEVFEHPHKSIIFADLLRSQSQASPEESKSRSDRVRLTMRGFLATVDSPGCDIYRDLVELYPKAKVVLSVRESDDIWWKSFNSTIAAQTTKTYEWLTYPVPFLRNQKFLVNAIAERWMRVAGTDKLGPDVHRAHNEDVRSNVPSEKLLVFNVKMGWKPLCEFLEVPIPGEPFPNLNDAKVVSRIIIGAKVMGACVWLLYLGLAVLLILLSIWPHHLGSLLKDSLCLLRIRH